MCHQQEGRMYIEGEKTCHPSIFLFYVNGYHFFCNISILFENKCNSAYLCMCCTFQGRRMPLKKSGIHIGRTTASLSSFLASSRSAMSSLKPNQGNQSTGPRKERRYSLIKAVRVQPTSVHLGYGTRYLSPVSPPGHCHILHHQTSSALHRLDLPPLFFPYGLKTLNQSMISHYQLNCCSPTLSSLALTPRASLNPGFGLA